jgi:hypothetical protein
VGSHMTVETVEIWASAPGLMLHSPAVVAAFQRGRKYDGKDRSLLDEGLTWQWSTERLRCYRSSPSNGCGGSLAKASQIASTEPWEACRPAGTGGRTARGA